jgi:hypothetical protein
VQVLATRGFTVTVADAGGGVVVASRSVRAGDPDGAKELLSCRWGPDAIGWRVTSGTVTVTVAARPSAPGSSVTIVGASSTAARLGSGRVADAGADDGSCVSSGRVEAAIAEAVAAR